MRLVVFSSSLFQVFRKQKDKNSVYVLKIDFSLLALHKKLIHGTGQYCLAKHLLNQFALK